MIETRSTDVRGLGEILAARAAQTPDQRAFLYLVDGEREEQEITYAQLHERAAAIAARLQETLPAGARVLLLFPPGLDFVTAIFGCFYAGVVAVSAAPPSPKRLHRTLPRLLAIAADADVKAVLTTAAIKDAAQVPLSGESQLRDAAWLAVDGGPSAPPAGWEPHAAEASDVVFLQYTSGTTAVPRGVALTGRNLLHNSEFIARAFGHGPDSCAFIWLPPYHDMGLIGGIVQPLYAGFPCVLTSPIAVIKRPARWLEGVSRHGATTTGGPNFAFDLCVDRISTAEKDGLDLSRLDVAFNGAEPIRPETIRSFTEAFRPCGFRREAFLGCYGLAEATLMVTASDRDEPPVEARFDTAALRAGRVEPERDGAGTLLVGSGLPEPGHDLVVADPGTHEVCPPERIGEVWVAGASVASGYWRLEEESGQVFGARIASDPDRGPFLRTGDLGFVAGEELFVVGRLKDLLIVRGVNHHPHDIEAAAELAHPLLRAHCSAAFALDEDGDDRLALVMEVEPAEQPVLDEVRDAVRRRVADDLQLVVHAVTLWRAGEVPKTTSGKVQRKLCRSILLEESVEPLASWRLEGAEL
jgi:acyl-CoA synthetase (AMP-forming)/AMP-acid ligase II